MVNAGFRVSKLEFTNKKTVGKRGVGYSDFFSVYPLLVLHLPLFPAPALLLPQAPLLLLRRDALCRRRQEAGQDLERRAHRAQGPGGVHVRGVPPEGQGEAGAGQGRAGQGGAGVGWDAGGETFLPVIRWAACFTFFYRRRQNEWQCATVPNFIFSNKNGC